MSGIERIGKNWLANFFLDLQFWQENDSQENFLGHLLESISQKLQVNNILD